MNKPIVYIITNRITGKVYVGQTNMEIAKRWAAHKVAAKRNSMMKLHQAMREYDTSNFTCEPILTCLCESWDPGETREIERLVIDQYLSDDPSIGYNHKSRPSLRLGKSYFEMECLRKIRIKEKLND